MKTLLESGSDLLLESGDNLLLESPDDVPASVVPVPPGSLWQFILTDLSGNVHGEVTNADERRVNIPFLRVPTATFRLPLWHYLAPTVTETDCLLKAYRTRDGERELVFHGPVVTAEEVAEGDVETVAVTAAGPLWRLTKRYIGKAKPGIGWGIPTPIDLGLIAHNILDTVNADSFTGVSKGGRVASTDGGAGPWHLKNAAEAIADLHGGLDSFEYVIDPTEPTAVGGVHGWPQIGAMNIAPIIGVDRPDVILEFGTGEANIASYTRTVTREGMLTNGIISVEGWPDAAVDNLDLLLTLDPAYATRGLFEDIIPDSGMIDNGIRQSILDLHLLIRKNPRQIIIFRPRSNATIGPFLHYEVGDTIRARAVVAGNLRFDADFRVWGMSFVIDKNGNEQLDLELVIP